MIGRRPGQYRAVIGRRLAQYRDRCREAILEAIREEHTPHQIGVSFGIGIFVTALPTGGLGVGLFFVLVSLWSWISKPAIFASVVVLNPVIKPAVYVASFQVGGLLLGPRSAETRTESAGLAVQQLLIGNVVVACCLSVLGYLLLAHLTRFHRQRKREDTGLSIGATLLGPFRRR